MNYDPDMFDPTNRQVDRDVLFGLRPRPLDERSARPPTPPSVWIILAAGVIAAAMCLLWAAGVGR